VTISCKLYLQGIETTHHQIPTSYPCTCFVAYFLCLAITAEIVRDIFMIRG